MFRFIKRLLITVILLAVIIPVAVVGLALIDDIQPPVYLDDSVIEEYDDVENVFFSDLDKMVFQFISGDQSMKFNEIEVNKTIFGYFGGFKEGADNEIGKDIPNFNVKGIWIDVEDDNLTLYLQLGYWKIGTTMTARVNVKTVGDEVVITLSKFKVGKLPIPKFLFSQALKQASLDIDYGEIDANTVALKIKKEVIQEEIDKAMKNQMILFDSLILIADDVVFKFALNSAASPEAQVLLDTINEFKNVVENDTLVTNVADVINNLDIPEEDQENVDQFLEDLVAVNDLLKDKILTTGEVTDEDIEALLKLQESFANIPNQQEDIVQAIENSFDSEIIENLSSTLESLGIEGFENIADLLLGARP